MNRIPLWKTPSKRIPTVSSLELHAVEDIFGMGNGYVLNFTNREFAGFFADLGIDIDQELPDGSKAKRLREFLREADDARVAQVLEALLEHRGPRDGDDASPNLAKVKNLVSRLRKTQIAMLPVTKAVPVLNLAYVHELEAKIDQRLASADLDGAITASRTMLEAVLFALQQELVGGARDDFGGDLGKLFKQVGKAMNLDTEKSIDDRFKDTVRGLVMIVSGLAPLRNKLSDSHARQKAPAPHHARVVVNAAKTIAVFLVESYAFQLETGLIKSRSGGAA